MNLDVLNGLRALAIVCSIAMVVAIGLARPDAATGAAILVAIGAITAVLSRNRLVLTVAMVAAAVFAVAIAADGIFGLALPFVVGGLILVTAESALWSFDLSAECDVDPGTLPRGAADTGLAVVIGLGAAAGAAALASVRTWEAAVLPLALGGAAVAFVAVAIGTWRRRTRPDPTTTEYWMSP